MAQRTYRGGTVKAKSACDAEKSAKQIYVTQPYLPPLEEFIPLLKEIWESRILTNGGPFHQQLERELCSYLGVEHLSLFSNGTIALITALQALEITGDVITTPYSFAATSHSLLWNGINPIFVDIDEKTLNLAPDKIEEAITPNTTAILPVHVYGHPCDVQAIKKVAEKYNLKVIYDAAHAFGVQLDDGSILKHGDLSVLSFHATKVFNTFEGGAIVCPNAEVKKKIDQLKNFGFVDETTVVAPGINGKMSEVNAALGLLQLKYIDSALARRKEIDRTYRKKFSSVKGLRCLENSGEAVENFSYFPILIEATYPLSRDELYYALRRVGIFARRYFYPLISNFPMYSHIASGKTDNIPIATKAAEQILCLPIYPELSTEDQQFIISEVSKHATLT